MNQILGRLFMTSVMVSLGMHGIGYALETNGRATRSNPMWKIVCSYFDFEKASLLLLLFYGAVTFGIYLLVSIGMKIFGSPPPETDEEKEKREEKERAERRAMETAREEQEYAAYLAEQSSKVRPSNTLTTQVSADAERENRPAHVLIPAPTPKELSPEELKQRAIRQLFKG